MCTVKPASKLTCHQPWNRFQSHDPLSVVRKKMLISSICRGPACDGKLEGRMVTCQKHSAKFDVTTAKCVPGSKIGCLRLKMDDARVFEVMTQKKRVLISTGIEPNVKQAQWQG